MFRQLKKNLVATLIAAVALGSGRAPRFADPADTLPDMGTSAGSTPFYWTRDANGRLLCAPATR
ncbi:Exported zinc metalloprotease YfgC precursor [Salmonella enterica subsp. arizonae]|uniref:Exported zinc metalloprotease YfgC n=1 Tax=Salmonella enterica subsp. arizonae TaxID=59203 RepID=A0A2X4T7L6_SALER|nr:Exported zinc metalloprotease YfgC precursor [Salmonella enterica subsp. arizonae]